MSLHAFNRRHWIGLATSLLTCTGDITSLATAQSPSPMTRVSTIAPSHAEHHVPVVTALAIDPSGTWVAVAGDDKTIRILNAASFDQVAVLRGHRDLVRTVDFRQDGRILLSAGNDGSLILWDASKNYQEVRRVDDLPAISCARFAPDSKQIAAVGFGHDVMMFGKQSEQLEMQCDCSDLRACVFDRSGTKLAAAGRLGHLHLFNPVTGIMIDEFELHVRRIRACDFSDDGKQMITVGEDGAAVWFDLTRGEVIRRIDLLPCKLFALARIDATRVAVAGSDNRIRIVNFEKGIVESHLDGHRGSISTLVYKNGALFSGGFDSTLRRWAIGSDAGDRVAEKDISPVPPKEISSR